MEKQEISLADLERLAAAMARELPNLDCPECCDCDWIFQYVERSAGLYADEWEWACLSDAMVRYRLARQSGTSEPR